jgi:hypothetical protein
MLDFENPKMYVKISRAINRRKKGIKRSCSHQQRRDKRKKAQKTARQIDNTQNMTEISI